MSEPNILHDILSRSGFSPTTQENYRRIIDRWIEFAGSEPAGWTRIKAQKWYDKLIADGKRVSTANVYLASLRYVSKWYATRMSDPNLDFAVVQTRADDHVEKTRHALTQVEVTQLLQSIALPAMTPLDRRDLVMVVIGLETGMRRKSIAGMEIEKIGPHPRYQYPIARVPIKGAGGTVEYPVPLSDLCVTAITSWRRWLTKQKYTKGAVFSRLVKNIGPKGDTVWSPTGGLSLPMINKIMDTRAQRAGFDLHPHLLRHTFISWREAAGLTPVQIASITGHRPSKSAEPSQNWGAMAGYIDLEMVGETARNSTPPWLVTLVTQLLEA